MGHRLAIGQRCIDARIHPRALFDQFGKESQLACRAPQFAAETRFRQAGFEPGSIHDLVAGGFQVGCDAAQEGSPSLSGDTAEGCLSRCGELRCRVHIFGSG
jgi:hypothetical protein